jgi:hypothetical protein
MKSGALTVMKILADQLRAVDAHLSAIDEEIAAWQRESAAAQALKTIPGVGGLISAALAAHVPDPSMFRSGRDFAAWLGLVPRQNSSGGKERLGRITKQGNPYLRRLLVLGATASFPAATFRPKPSWARLSRTERYELATNSPAQAASPTSKRSGTPGGSVRRAAVRNQSRTAAMAVTGSPSWARIPG